MLRLSLLLVCLLPLGAQSWDDVRALRPGDHVKVLDDQKSEHQGTLTSVPAEMLNLAEGKGTVAIPRANIRRVQVRSGSRRARNAAIGVAIGVAVGVTADQTLGAYFRNESGESGARAVTYIAPIALFGGITAALPAYRTVYRIDRR